MMVSTNVDALIAANSLSRASAEVAKASERLSTNQRINRAQDDPAGLAIAARLKARISSLSKVLDNINSGISAVQTVDSSLSDITDLLTNMRDLALSSSSGTTDSATRVTNQVLLKSYRSEIDRIASSTVWNGRTLLDGSTPAIAVQIGPDPGDVSSLSLFSVQSSAIGAGNPLALSSTGTGTTALSTGDLIINGYTVGASSSADDSASTTNASGSAIAKAAAINRISGTTNVYATVGTTEVSGASMSAVATTTSGTITINGVAINFTLSAGDTASARATVISQINNYAAQTGVKALDSGSSTDGVRLEASDGRNITVSQATFTSADTGIAADGTYGGKFTLRNLDGVSSVTLSSQVGKSISNAGLTAGTYTANAAQFSTQARAGSSAAPTALTYGDLMINGVVIGAAASTDDTASANTTTSSTRSSSAIAMAAAINRKSAQTSVTATVNPNVVVGTSFTPASVSSIYLNGVTITSALSSSSTRADVVTLLNGYTGQTGVLATDNGSGLTLTAADGRNISVGVADGASLGLGGLGIAGAATAAGTTTFISTVKLSSDAPITLAPGSNGSANFTTMGFSAGNFGGTAEDVKLSTVDITTQTGAGNALQVIDSAITQVSGYQAIVGAQQNRLDFQSSFAQDSGTVSAAAYGNIMDADIAQESVKLAAGKMIESAATAMLAQANMSRELVSYLLKQYTG